jgi:DNA invertase Pin-like site-specific DNA recombinase
MIAICYTRAENAKAAEKTRKGMAAWCGRHRHDYAAFDWDPMSGQRGLNRALYLAEHTDDHEVKAPGLIVVDNLSDLSRDLPGLVKQITALIDKGISIYSMASDLTFDAGDIAPESIVIRALAQAHIKYSSDNRKRAIASAREAGATIGRPRKFTLDGARKTIRDLTDSKTGRLPSVRDLAKRLGCGHTRAGELLREYVKRKKKRDETNGS